MRGCAVSVEPADMGNSAVRAINPRTSLVDGIKDFRILPLSVDFCVTQIAIRFAARLSKNAKRI